jgi:hypothetical protein
MKKYMLVLSALLLPTAVHAEEGKFPGSAWFNITGPQVAGEEKGNWILSGRVTQDAVLTEVSDWKLSATTSVGFSKDTKGFEWNNKLAPSVGLKVSREAAGGYFDATVQYVYERRYGTLYRTKDRSDSGVQLSINYWVGWGR